MEKREEKEREREKRGKRRILFYTRGRVTCLFRVVEQIYIALSLLVIPLSRCCCRTLDSVQREIKGGREEKGKTRGKKKMKEKREIYLEISAPAARRNVRVMYALPANANFISPRSCICRRLSALRRRNPRCEPFIFGSALRSNRCRVKPTCPRQS